MANIHRTSRGAQIDMDRLKLLNETTIAVGNAGVNARGDEVKGNQIVKPREQIAQETYNLSGNNIAKQAKIRRSSRDIEPDVLPELQMMNPYEDLTSGNRETVKAHLTPTTEGPRGGLANAVQKSKDIKTVLDAQKRNRI